MALRRVARNNNITDLDGGDIITDGLNDTSGFVTQDGWELTFGVVSIKSVDICMTECIGKNLNSNLASLWWLNLNFSDIKWLLSLPGNCGLASDHLSLGLLEISHELWSEIVRSSHAFSL